MTPPPSNYPLCVDLDGTLVRTDTLLELMLVQLKHNPLIVGRWLWWFRRGRAFFKHNVASSTDLAYNLLPYHEGLLAFLREEHARGRQLYLATASAKIIAAKVAAELGIFTGVIGSEGLVNQKGAIKAKTLVEQFGEKQFSYAGNAATDLSVWTHAAEGIVVSDRPALIRRARATTNITHVFSNKSPVGLMLLKAMRPYQWAKNILVAIPLIASHNLAEPTLIMATLVAAAAFSLTASAVYLLNDLFDLESDRRHPRKKYRPLAAGRLPLGFAITVIPLLLLAGIALAALLPPLFLGMLVAYLVLTGTYSWWLKRVVLVDVFLLALLYTLRIYAGAAAISVPVSSWLTAFGLFFFLSLAVVKRYTELQRLRHTEESAAHGRGYIVADREPLAQMGISSGFVAAVILALYISSPEIGVLYSTPLLLWLLVPLQLYWLSRIWFLAHRHTLVDDPLIFALRDKVSYLVALGFVAVVLAAT